MKKQEFIKWYNEYTDNGATDIFVDDESIVEFLETVPDEVMVTNFEIKHTRDYADFWIQASVGLRTDLGYIKLIFDYNVKFYAEDVESLFDTVMEYE